MLSNHKRILVTGGTGLIGKNLSDRLTGLGFEILSFGSEHDLRNNDICEKLVSDFKPDVVFHLAAKVGGILANSTYKADFYSDNVLINTNIVNAAVRHDVEYIFAMGTGCAYPKRLENSTLYEDDFLDGIPESTNDAYAYAKRGLLVHLQALAESGGPKFTYCLPSNIYGPHDNFHPQHSHVVPGLIRRFCDAQESRLPSLKVWGDGTARRDFLYIDDCIDAILLLANHGSEGVFNVCTGQLTSVRQLASEIKMSSGFAGEILYDEALPAGQMQRIFDTSKMDSLGWKPSINLATGIMRTIEWFKANRQLIRER